MLQILSTLNPNKPHFKQVRSLFSALSLFFSTSHIDPSLSHSTDQTKNTHIDLSPIDCSRIVNSVILRFSHLLDDKKDKSFAKASLKDLLLDIYDIVPDIARRFRRVLVLKPEDVLELLMGFESECEKVGFKARKVGALWEIFKWANKQNGVFKHMPKSCEVMASILLKVGMLKEVELLLLGMEIEGISLGSGEIFDYLIEGYVGCGQWKRAAVVFDRMRGRGFIPSLSCYCIFLNLLVKMKRTLLSFRVCMDVVGMGIKLSDREKTCIENVVRLLCRDGKIQEARTLVRKVMALGLEPSSLVVNEIARGYCEKKDFEDLLSFFVEMKHAPGVLAGNKMIYTLCSNFGVENAEIFRLELEHLGFMPDEMTFGILIGWSCSKGDLRKAFIYLSEIFSRGLKPDINTYNALIGGVFKEGMWKHARDILDEMRDQGISLDSSIFRTLLAGYCRARRFDEVKMIVSEMANRGLIELSSIEDPLSNAFGFLGLNPLDVRLKRDNSVGLFKTEFYDNLGNGLYLDTNLYEYEKKVTGILVDSMMPDFNLLVRKECAHGNFRTALMLADEMVRWNQELSLPVFSALVKGLFASQSHVKAGTALLKKAPKLADQLDEETLNLLVRAYSKKGLTYKARTIFSGMVQRDLKIKNQTYTALLLGLCRRGNLRDLRDCWDVARKDKWSLGLEDSKVLVECLCQKKMLRESLELLESMLMSCPHLKIEVCHIYIEKLCATGYASVAHVLVEELLRQDCVLDHMAFSHLLRGLCKERKFSVAFTILDMMLAKNLVPCLDVFITLIPQLCRANKFDGAVALREILGEQSTFTLSFHSALMKGFYMMGKHEKADNLFQNMLSKGLLPDADVHNMLVQGHCEAKNLRKVREILSVMIRKHLSLTISSYRHCVRLMCAQDGVLYALNLKEFMLGQSRSPSLIIYNILVFYLLSSRNNLFVSGVLNDMHEKGMLLDEVGYNFLVYGFSQCKDMSSSLNYLSTMISQGLRPSNRSLRTIISCLCDLGELERALEVSQEMELRGWNHDSIVQNAIVMGFLSHGKVQDAEQFLDQMVDKGLNPDGINYDNLIKQFCWYGRVNKAVDLLNIMLKKGSMPNSTSYDSVIHGLCACNELDQAMDFYTEMLDRDLKPCINTWDMLVHKFCQEGQTAEAERLLISMVQVGETPTREMYSSVIDRYRSENNLRKALGLMQAMQRSGYDPHFDMHWSLISNLSSCTDKENENSNQGFLSRLLSGSGFTWKKDSESKLG